MSQFTDAVKHSGVSFVFPKVSNVIWARLGTSDKALCTVLGTCYIEADSLDMCIMLTEYVCKVAQIRAVGNVDNVKSGAITTYRQRLVINRLLDIVGIASKFSIPITITKDLFVTDTVLEGVDILNDVLTQYLSYQNEIVQEKGLNWWLTAVTITQFVTLCNIYGVSIFYQCFEEAFSTRGLWYRAPLLCSSYLQNPLRASIILLDRKQSLVYSEVGELNGTFMDMPHKMSKRSEILGVNLDNTEFTSSENLQGFSGRNVLRDIKRGLIFKNEG